MNLTDKAKTEIAKITPRIELNQESTLVRFNSGRIANIRYQEARITDQPARISSGFESEYVGAPESAKKVPIAAVASQGPESNIVCIRSDSGAGGCSE